MVHIHRQGEEAGAVGELESNAHNAVNCQTGSTSLKIHGTYYENTKCSVVDFVMMNQAKLVIHYHFQDHEGHIVLNFFHLLRTI